MPELPEVEVIARGLAPVLEGRLLEAVLVSGKPLRSFSGRASVLRPLRGQRLIDLSRRAKTLIWTFERHWMAIHLGMSGVLLWRPGTDVGEPPPHCHLRCRWEHGELWFVDPRRFGDIRVLARPEGVMGEALGAGDPSASLLGASAAGHEPLSDTLCAADLVGAAKGVRQSVKVWLMKGDPLVGVGNIYASESLHRAGIHPARAAGRIAPQRLILLLGMIRLVLEEAIAAGGSTLRDYRQSDGASGRYAGQHRVYGRAGEPCIACARPIRRIIQAQRATYFCSGCQR